MMMMMMTVAGHSDDGMSGDVDGDDGDGLTITSHAYNQRYK